MVILHDSHRGQGYSARLTQRTGLFCRTHTENRVILHDSHREQGYPARLTQRTGLFCTTHTENRVILHDSHRGHGYSARLTQRTGLFCTTHTENRVILQDSHREQGYSARLTQRTGLFCTTHTENRVIPTTIERDIPATPARIAHLERGVITEHPPGERGYHGAPTWREGLSRSTHLERGVITEHPPGERGYHGAPKRQRGGACSPLSAGCFQSTRPARLGGCPALLGTGCSTAAGYLKKTVGLVKSHVRKRQIVLHPLLAL